MKSTESQNTLHHVRPSFASKFECLGSACPEDCCSGWRIPIDRSTFNRYKRSDNLKLRDRFQNLIVQVSEAASNQNFAYIKKDGQTSQCAFLDKGLCDIQTNLGHDGLSDTCFSFPRSYTKFEEEVELSMSLSCPEAARLALTTRDAFEFEATNSSVRASLIRSIQDRPGIDLREVNRFRIVAIQLMKDPGQASWKKLLSLGVLCERFDSLMSKGLPNAAETIRETYEHLSSTGELYEVFDRIKPQPKLQSEAFLLLMQTIAIVPTTKIAKERIDVVLSGFDADIDTGEIRLETLADCYREGIAALDAALADTPWFLDHVLLADMLTSGFPFDGRTTHESFVGLASRFGIVRLILAGACRSLKLKATIHDLAQFVQTFVRHYQHNSEFASKVNSCLLNSGWGTLDKLVLFLRSA